MPMISINSLQQRAPDWTRHVAVFQNSESEYGSPPRNWDTMAVCESPFPPGQLTPFSTKSPHTPRTPRSRKTVKKFKHEQQSGVDAALEKLDEFGKVITGQSTEPEQDEKTHNANAVLDM